MIQISTHIYCDELLETLEIENKLLPSPYKEYPYLIIKNFFSDIACAQLVSLVEEDEESKESLLEMERYNLSRRQISISG